MDVRPQSLTHRGGSEAQEVLWPLKQNHSFCQTLGPSPCKFPRLREKREACRARTIPTSAEGQLCGTVLLGQCLPGVDIAPDWPAGTGLHSALALVVEMT